jgi:hypothetical protein
MAEGAMLRNATTTRHAAVMGRRSTGMDASVGVKRQQKFRRIDGIQREEAHATLNLCAISERQWP